MTRLVVDIGGTSIRLAYCRDHSPELFNISQFACADYTRVDDVLLEYCARHKLDSDEFVLAVAGRQPLKQIHHYPTCDAHSIQAEHHQPSYNPHRQIGKC